MNIPKLLSCFALCLLVAPTTVALAAEPVMASNPAALGLHYPVIVDDQSFTLNGSACYTRVEGRPPLICMPALLTDSNKSLYQIQRFIADPAARLSEGLGSAAVFSDGKLGAVVFESGLSHPVFVVDWKYDGEAPNNVRVVYLRLPLKDFSLARLKEWLNNEGGKQLSFYLNTGILKPDFLGQQLGASSARGADCGGSGLVHEPANAIRRALVNNRCTSFTPEQRLLQQEIDTYKDQLRRSEEVEDLLLLKQADLRQAKELAGNNQEQLRQSLDKIEWGARFYATVYGDPITIELSTTLANSEDPCWSEIEKDDTIKARLTEQEAIWRKEDAIMTQERGLDREYAERMDAKDSDENNLVDELARIAARKAATQDTLAKVTTLDKAKSKELDALRAPYLAKCAAEKAASLEAYEQHVERLKNTFPETLKLQSGINAYDGTLKTFDELMESIRGQLIAERERGDVIVERWLAAFELRKTSEALEEACYSGLSALEAGLADSVASFPGRKMNVSGRPNRRGE